MENLTGVRINDPARELTRAFGRKPSFLKTTPGRVPMENRNRCILIVDDDPFALSVSSRVLREAGFVVYTAELWAKVAGLIRQTNPDLILLDYNMPSLKGDDICSIVKGSNLRTEMKIVFYSSEDPRFLQETVRKSGADGYISKGLPPLALAEEVRRFLPAQPPRAETSGSWLRRVLIVDDSPIIRRMCRQIISGRYNCEIVEAADGAQGMEAVNHKPFNLILLDVNMPGMSGLDFLQRARQDGRLNGAAVIICSTEGKEDDVLRALRQGASNYLIKPFTPDALSSVIEDISRRRRET